MSNRKYVVILLLMIGFVCMSSVSANDLNLTDGNSLSEDLGVDSDILESAPQSDLLEDDNVVYFNASASSNGDGSKTNPYKYVNSNTLKGTENGLTAYFANGVYDLNVDFKITSSSIVLIGESNENTIFNSILSNKYDFKIMQDFKLELNNISFNHANIINYGTLKLTNVNFNNCEAFASYSNQYDSSYGGVIISDSIGNSRANVYIDNCVFDDNLAYCGGAISLRNSNLIIKNSSFSNSRAERLGGVIYASDSNINISNSSFESNNASYGGVIYCEGTTLDLIDSNIDKSRSYSFGGFIASKHSHLNVQNCKFNDYESLTDAGGAIYSLRDNVNIFNSSFVNGWAKFGGAIAILESNLTVLSSKFIDNAAYEYGGSIYNIYGSIYLNNSFFNISDAFAGGAICARLSSSLTFTNNIFLNCTEVDGGAIYIDTSNEDIVESGNYFENAYHVSLEYTYWLNNEKFTLKSNVLNYVLSSTGSYLNSYDYGDFGTDYNEFVNLYCNDVDYPQSSTVFGTFDTVFHYEYYLNKLMLFDRNFKNNEYLLIHLYDDAGNLLYENMGGYLWETLQVNDTYFLNLENRVLSKTNNAYNIGSLEIPVSLINSTYGDLTILPSAYDSRDYGYVTPVKDQAEGGNCWAFSGIATLEACIKKITNIEYDFSEENAKNLMAAYSTLGLELNPNQGGYDSMMIGYLTSWLGPILETTEVYDDLSSLSAAYYPKFYIQNIKFLPARKNNLDNDLFKRAIIDYGAVSVTFSWLSSGYHAVSLVGWDDNYKGYDSLGKYAKGAWIFKNSWGTDWGDGGFGYLSYDTPFASDINDYCHAYTFVFNRNYDYMYTYQYDFSGASDYICYEGHIFYENKFTCDVMFGLKGVSTYFKYPTNYIVSVYQNGNLILSQRGYSDAGYCTIPFDFTYAYSNFILIDEGEEFTIRIENCNNGWNFIPVCQAEELNLPLFKSGTSFISYDGENWFDLYDLEDYTDFLYSGVKPDTHQVACIKAFGNMGGSFAIGMNVDKFDSVDLNEKCSIDVTINDAYEYLIENIEGSLVSFDINGTYYYAKIHDGKASLIISFDKAGVYNVSPRYRNNLYHYNCDSFTFTVNKGKSVVYVDSLTKKYGGKEKLLVTLKDGKGKIINGADLTVNLNGKSIKVKTNSKGQAAINIDVAPKTYAATIVFKGNGNYIGTSKKVSVVVKKATPKLTASKKTFKLKVKTKKYTVVLKDNNGKAINKGKITLKVKGKTFKATTIKGKATFKITNLKKKRTFKAVIKYGGNNFYNAVTKNVKIIVK